MKYVLSLLYTFSRLLTDLENEDMRKREVEQEKVKLQDQLELLMAQLSELDLCL